MRMPRMATVNLMQEMFWQPLDCTKRFTRVRDVGVQHRQSKVLAR